MVWQFDLSLVFRSHTIGQLVVDSFHVACVHTLTWHPCGQQFILLRWRVWTCSGVCILIGVLFSLHFCPVTCCCCCCRSCCHSCLCPQDLIDHCLHHWCDSVPPGGVRSLRQHYEGQSHLPPAGGWPPHHATAGNVCHCFLHQLCHHHDPQPHVWESGCLDHWHGWGSEREGSVSLCIRFLFQN